MIPSRRALAAVVALASIAWGAAPAIAQDVDPAAREWNQDRGNADKTCVSAVAPIRAEPQVGWTQPLVGKLLGGPVTWGGVVYIAAGTDRRRELFAFDVLTGKQLAKKGFGAGAEVELAAWQGVVLVAEPGLLRGIPFKKGRFSFGWKKKEQTGASLCVRDGIAYVLSRAALRAYDTRTGRPVDLGDKSYLGAVAVYPGAGDASARVVSVDAGPRDRYKSWWLGLGEALAPSGKSIGRKWRHLVATESYSAAKRFSAVRLGKSWLVTSTRMLRGAEGLFPGVIAPDGTDDCWMSSILGTAAVYRDHAFGFASDGRLIRMGEDGRFRVLVKGDALPKGARPGEPSIAQDVICFGNWAVEIESGRVLWSLPGVVPVCPAIPVADRRLVTVTQDNKIVCLTDAPGAASAGAGATAASGGGAGRSPEPTLAPAVAPGSIDGVLLADGTHLVGDAEQPGNGVVWFRPESGEPRELDPDEIVVAVHSGRIAILGDAATVLGAWRSHLEHAAAVLYLELAEDGARKRLHGAARTMLERARVFGAPSAGVAAVEALFTGKRPHPNEELKSPRFLKDAAVMAEALYVRFLDGADWCAKNDRPEAAAALLAAARAVDDSDKRAEQRARALLPAGFPWKDSPDAGRLWMDWAAEIVPAGAEFVPSGDPAWRKVEATGWKRAGVIGLRTRSLLFFSKEQDRAVVGGCLRHGEGAVRAMGRLLDRPARRRDERLDVRLFADRDSYIADMGGKGASMSWTAGYYSPSQRVSRFYVSRDSESGDALGRSLYDTLAHELTHHFVNVRLMDGSHGHFAGPGYWVVEGIAQFVGDQSVEMGRRGSGMNDATVSSIDAAGQAMRADKLIPVEEFVDLPQFGFAKLSKERTLEVRLRNTLGARRLSATSVFYEQAGALTFFMLRRRGADGQAALIDYLKKHYLVKLRRGSWSTLGFESAAALDKAFREFLANPEAGSGD